MKRLIIVIIIALIILASAVVVQIYVDNTLQEISMRTNNIIQAIRTENIYNANIKSEINALDKYWKNNETILCVIINYTEIEEISNHISLLQEYVQQNKTQEGLIELASIKHFAKNYSNIFGFNWHNIL